MNFCTDVDLLRWEPSLPRDAVFASQTLAAGAGDLAADLFTVVDGPSLIDQRIEPGMTLTLTGAVAGCFAILEVIDAAALRCSRVHPGLFPEAPAVPESAPVGAASGLTFAIRTFSAQRQIVSEVLRQALDLPPSDAQAILRPSLLMRPCALGAIQLIYSAMAAVAEEPAYFDSRARVYAQLYQRSCRQLRLELDLNHDGRADALRAPALVRLYRE